MISVYSTLVGRGICNTGTEINAGATRGNRQSSKMRAGESEGPVERVVDPKKPRDQGSSTVTLGPDGTRTGNLEVVGSDEKYFIRAAWLGILYRTGLGSALPTPPVS